MIKPTKIRPLHGNGMTAISKTILNLASIPLFVSYSKNRYNSTLKSSKIKTVTRHLWRITSPYITVFNGKNFVQSGSLH